MAPFGKRVGGVVAAMALVCALWLAPAAQGATVVVNPFEAHGWSAEQVGSATARFELGPQVPPLGTGSFELTLPVTPGPNDRADLVNRSFTGTPLAGLTRLDYFNFVTHNQSGQCFAPYVGIEVDVDGDGVLELGGPDDTLTFEPCYQTGGFGTVPPGQTIPDQCPNPINDPIDPCFDDVVWNHWDARNGGWWSTSYGGANGPPLTTLSSYLQTLAAAGHTQPRIHSIRLRISVGWIDFDGNVDAVTVGINGADTTYDFETAPEPVEGLFHNAFLVSGTVLVNGVPLTDPEQIRDGSVINAEKGKVNLVSEYNGQLQSARFFRGKFRVQQARSRRPIVVLRLLGALARCRARAGGSSAEVLEHRTRRRHRHLFASGSGNYSTSGNRGAATVSGTKWLTTDLCRGRTLFLVRRGVIRIDDFGIPGRVNKVLRAGQRYIAQR